MIIFKKCNLFGYIFIMGFLSYSFFMRFDSFDNEYILDTLSSISNVFDIFFWYPVIRGNFTSFFILFRYF